MKLSAIALVLSAMTAAPAIAAEQSLYEQTDDGWYVYVEDKSCVAYVDHGYDNGNSTMMRFSSRVDEGRTYFSIVSPDWTMLEPLAGETLMLYLDFPKNNKAYGSSGMIMINPDGRPGFTAADFDIAELHEEISHEDEMRITVQMAGKPMLNVATVDIAGSDKAMTALEECTRKNFSQMAMR